MRYIILTSLFILSNCTPVKNNNTSSISIKDTKNSNKLTPLEQSCNNVTDCIECNKNKCYEYDITAKSCNKVGQQKSTIILIHIFLGPLGATAFMVGNYLFGGIQLALALSPLLWMWCYCCSCDKKDEIIDFIAKGGVCICYSIALGLWIWYFILIIEGKIFGKDGCPLIE
jgi:hypothetical protein